jgi:hypothetical protein
VVIVRCSRSIVALALLFAGTRGVTPAADNQPPVLTVCEALIDPDRYDGKSVIIVGRASGSFEGSWLAEDCGHKVVNSGP